MGSNFFDIPFRNRTTDSDFNCIDGELESAGNVMIFQQGKEYPGSEIKFINFTSDSIIPRPEIDFALVRDILPGWHLMPDIFPAKTLAVTDSSIDSLTKTGAQLLTQFLYEASSRHLFTAPFMVTAAWKTVGGRLLSPSGPVMLIPNSKAPLVNTESDPGSPDPELRIAAALCSLYFKMKSPEILRDYVGIVENLQILVSKPLCRYDSYRSFIPMRHVTTDSFCRSLDPDTGNISDHLICTRELNLAWKTNEIGTVEAIPSLSSLQFTPFASVPFDKIDLAKNWTRTGSLGSFDSEGLPVDFSSLETPGSGIKSEKVIIKGTGKDMDVTTRPIKLSGASILKSVSRVALRGNYTPANITITILASRDMLSWWTVAQRKGGTMAVLPCSPFRFFKISLHGLLSEGETIEGISFILR